MVPAPKLHLEFMSLEKHFKLLLFSICICLILFRLILPVLVIMSLLNVVIVKCMMWQDPHFDNE